MKPILAIFGREIRAYFLSPLAYVVLLFFLIVNGAFFVGIVDNLNDPRASVGNPLEILLGGFWWIILIPVVPALTMRLLAEERQRGSIEVLMTAPVTEGQVVVGKYLAALTFYVGLWLPTVVYALVLPSYAEADWGPVLSSYLGIFLLGAFFLAIGLFSSSLTRNQFIAFIVAFAILAVLVIGVALTEPLFDAGRVSDTLSYMSAFSHQDELSRGIVDTRRLVFYLSGTVFFLFLTARTLENNKWS